MKERHTIVFTIILVSVIAVVAIGLLVYLRHTENIRQEQADADYQALLQQIEQDLRSERERDSDNDGLPDEAEVLAFGTDPQNEDTDFDGFLDGDEVARGFDPTVHSDDDDRLVPELNDPENPSNISNQLIDLLQEQLGTTDVEALSTEDINSLVATYLGDIQTSDAVPDVPRESLNLSADTSADSLRAYLERPVESLPALVKVLSDQAGFDDIVQQARRNDDTTLDILIASSNKTYAELLGTPIPNDDEVVQLHVTNMKLIVLLKTVFEEMKKVDEDPVRSAVSVKYAQDALALARSTDGLLTRLRERAGLSSE